MTAKRALLGPVLWLLCVQFFVAEEIARFAWKSPYSMTRNYISDLGAVHCSTSLAGMGIVCSPLHWLMNGSFLLQGLLIFCGTLLMRRFFPRGKLFTFALFLIAIAGFGVFVVGLAPEDVNFRLHSFAAAQHFFCGNAGMAMLGIVVLSRSRSSLSRTFLWMGTLWMGTISLAMGLAGLLGMLLLSQHSYLGCGVGGMERIVAYPLPIWLAGSGTLFLVSQDIVAG